MAKKTSSRKNSERAERITAARAKAIKAAKAAPAKGGAMKPEPKVLKKTNLHKADLEEYRKMLMDKRRALLGDMSGIEAEAFRTNRQERSGDLSNIPIHPADIGSDNYEQEFTLGLLESERTLLKEINEALDRIDQGTYGICLGTGMPIDKARLRARPWAKYCIEYAHKIEKGLAQPSVEDSREETSVTDEEPAADIEDEEPAEEESED